MARSFRAPRRCATMAIMKRPGRPAYPSWNYSLGEILADGPVPALGIVLGLVGAAVLIAWAAGSAAAGEFAAVVVYVAALLAMLGLSAAYNLWPVSRTKWI